MLLPINVIMGSGFLGVPAGFVAAGLLLGPSILVVVTVLQWISACHLAQVASRAHALVLAKSAAATLTPTTRPAAKSSATRHRARAARS